MAQRFTLTNTNAQSQTAISHCYALGFMLQLCLGKHMTSTYMDRARPCLFQFPAKGDRKTSLDSKENNMN